MTLSDRNKLALDNALTNVKDRYIRDEIRDVMEMYGTGLSPVQVDRFATHIALAWQYGKVAGQSEILELQNSLTGTVATESPVPELDTPLRDTEVDRKAVTELVSVAVDECYTGSEYLRPYFEGGRTK